FVLNRYKSDERISKDIYEKTRDHLVRRAVSWCIKDLRKRGIFNSDFKRDIVNEIGVVDFYRFLIVSIVKKVPTIIKKAPTKLISLAKPSPAFLRTGEDFGKQLESALSDPTDIERKQLRKLFEETSLAIFWTYYVAGKAAPHYHMPWEGREMTKLPMDVLVYKDLIESSRADVLIEIGTQRGTSALFLASILKPLGGKVITLDLVSPPPDVLEEFRRLDIEFIKGDVTADEVAQKVEELVEGKRCMVVDDGSHKYD
ncbi:unnamed protein product, partial [marine sediment metagenome]